MNKRLRNTLASFDFECSDTPYCLFTTFGDLLKYLRRRAGLTQRELSIAVGYSTAQICRLEQNQRLPDIPTLTARFVPELGLDDEPRAVNRLLALAVTVRREDAPAAGLPPFTGLLYFDESDTELFVGREALTAHLVARLTASLADRTGLRFLAVVGASGSGKSSVVRAGLIPAVRWNSATAGWPVHALTPTAHPLEAVTASLLGEAMTATGQARLVDAMAADPNTLHHTLQRQLQPASSRHALIVVDQFEELFTLCRSAAERRAFVDNLMVAAGCSRSSPDLPVADRVDGAPAGGAVVVIALRADFYAPCADFPNLRRALAQHQEYIGGMTADELRRAIEEPARRGHWELEPGLVDVLLQDVGADGFHAPEPGALPLLSHALLETWHRRRGGTLTLTGYAATGGVRGAIAETAEAVFHDQLSPEQRATARRIFLRLTELGPDETIPETRRRVRLNELVGQPTQAAAVREVLTLLADARLITTEEETVEVAHEALIREWPTLRQWLSENRAALRLHRHLTEAAQEWERTRRDEGLTYRGARLAQALEWEGANPSELNVLERGFLDTSQALAEREAAEREAQRQRELASAQKLAEAETRRADEQAYAARQLGRRALYLAGAFVVALVMAGLAPFFGEQAQQAAATAQAQERIALSRELAAAAVSNLDVDPERSLLLAVEAVSVTYAVDQRWTAEAEAALRRALLASRVELTLRGHTDHVDNVAFHPDGTRLATTSNDGTAIVWDADNGRVLLTLTTGAKGGHHGLAFSPDGTLLAASGAEGTATVWDVATTQALLTLRGHSDWVSSVAFSPDGTRLATASEDRTAKVWDLVTGEELLTLRGHTDAVWGVAFSRDGTQIATTSQDGTAKVWDAGTGRLMRTLAARAGVVYGVAFGPECVAGPEASAPECGPRLATGGADGSARIWNPVTGAELLTLNGHSGLVANVAFSPDGRRLATTSFDGKAKVWDAVTGRELLTLAGHTGPVLGVAFSPDCGSAPQARSGPCGTRLATTSFDGTAKVWNVGPSRELLTLTIGGLTSSALSPDGARLATGLADGTVRVWDLSRALNGAIATGRAALTLRGHTGAVNAVAFSADGARLATASRDGTAKVWDADSGQDLLTLFGHTSAVVDVSYDPDGTRLKTTGADGAVRFYLLRIEDLVALTQTRVTRTFTADECQQYLHLERCRGEAGAPAILPTTATS